MADRGATRASLVADYPPAHHPRGVLPWTASFERILLDSGVGLAIFLILTVAAVYVLRRRRPDLPRPFRTPVYPFVPAVYLAGTGVLTAAVFCERPVVSSISLLSIAVGVPVYYLGTSATRRARLER